MLCWSSCGESGTARGKPDPFAPPRLGNCEGEGICRLRPLPRMSGLRPARGVSGTAWSSLLVEWCSFSRKVGEGWRALGARGGSEKERDLEGVLEGESAAEGGGRSIVLSIVRDRGAKVDKMGIRRGAFVDCRQGLVSLGCGCSLLPQPGSMTALCEITSVPDTLCVLTIGICEEEQRQNN